MNETNMHPLIFFEHSKLEKKSYLLELSRSVHCWKVKVLIQNECLCELVVRDAFIARSS